MTFTLIETLDVKNTLGEGILWDEISESLWWTDIQESKLYQYVLDEKTIDTFTLPERLGSFGFVHGDERLICAFESGIALYSPKKNDYPDTNPIAWISKPEASITGTRFNDGRVDRQGRFWAGTLVEGETKDKFGNKVLGGVYRVDGNGTQKVLSNIEIANSLCWSPDSKTMYFADSPRREILAYDFDSDTGVVLGKHTFAQTPENSFPDGSCIDAEGYLWNAVWGGSKVVRYKPSGDVDCVLELPVSQPTCVCFAGKNLDLLCVTTAGDNLTAAEIARQPLAGCVFIFKTDFTGLKESRFLLNKNIP